MLNLLPKKKKVDTCKTPTKTGTPAQGNLLTKKGTAQNFTWWKNTHSLAPSPVPAASSPELPKTTYQTSSISRTV